MLALLVVSKSWHYGAINQIVTLPLKCKELVSSLRKAVLVTPILIVFLVWRGYCKHYVLQARNTIDFTTPMSVLTTTYYPMSVVSASTYLMSIATNMIADSVVPLFLLIKCHNVILFVCYWIGFCLAKTWSQGLIDSYPDNSYNIIETKSKTLHNYRSHILNYFFKVYLTCPPFLVILDC